MSVDRGELGIFKGSFFKDESNIRIDDSDCSNRRIGMKEGRRIQNIQVRRG